MVIKVGVVRSVVTGLQGGEGWRGAARHRSVTRRGGSRSMAWNTCTGSDTGTVKVTPAEWESSGHWAAEVQQETSQ